MTRDLFHLAAKYHRTLPDHIRDYLHRRGIPDAIISRHFLGWNGTRITIPVFNHNGVCASFRLAKDPEDTSDTPKMLSQHGAPAELYGWEVLRLKPHQVIICEGEFDRLVLEANGFDAVTSTAGAGSFKPEWAEAFAPISEVYICFDCDHAGRKGARRVASMIGRAKIVELPSDLGEGGDITDFFVRFQNSPEDFEKLLLAALPIENDASALSVHARSGLDERTRARMENIKRTMHIEHLVGHYVGLRRSGATLVGHCPFHEDHTPSFTVYPNTGTFYCFGCRAHGDVIAFLQKAEHLSFGQALSALERAQPDDEARPQ